MEGLLGEITTDLQALRAATDGFLAVMFSSTKEMPFGLRYIARELFRALGQRFSSELEGDLVRLVGHFLFYRFIQPAIM